MSKGSRLNTVILGAGQAGLAMSRCLQERNISHVVLERHRHTDGVCTVPGLYCLGFTWLRRRISGLLAGVASDAGYIAERIADRS